MSSLKVIQDIIQNETTADYVAKQLILHFGFAGSGLIFNCASIFLS